MATASGKDKPIKDPQTGRYSNVDFIKAVGFKYPPIKCSYNRRDVLLFANAIGILKDEPHFLYELHPQFAAFPTFPINLAFKQTDSDVFDFLARTVTSEVPGVPPFDPQRSVDGERSIEIIRQIPVSSDGLELEVRGEVTGVYDKGGNMILEAEDRLLDMATNPPTLYARLKRTAFGIGQGGYNGPRGPQVQALPKVPSRDPDATHVYATTPEQAFLYRLCGDYNPLHADDEFGKRAGFRGAILQGLGTWNIAAHGVVRELGDADPKRLLAFGARFKSVVYPGDVLETRMWIVGRDSSKTEVLFETVVKGDGRVALSNGFARLRSQQRSSKI